MTCRSAYDDKGPQLHVLEVGALGWQEHATLKADLVTMPESGANVSVTSMCLVNDAVWFGDNLGYIHAFDSNTYEKKFSYKMEPGKIKYATSTKTA